MEAPLETIAEWVFDSHDRARRKGWYEPPKTFAEEIALVHSEASEALEEHRDGRGYTEVYWRDKKSGACYANPVVAGPVKELKPEGIPIELADILIRVFDMAGKYGIDLTEALMTKAAYNETRPFRHGDKKV